MPAKTTTNKSTPKAKAGPKHYLLLVEDDPDLADMYALILNGAGYGVVAAQSAQSALDALDKHVFDLIILDILLPENNGLSVLHELRSYEDWRNLPVIVLSNIPLREVGLTPSGMAELGISLYLEKADATAQKLLEAVAANLRKRRD